MKVLKPWQTVAITVAVSFLLVLWDVPTSTWVTSATLSLASGVAALALMATSAILASRWAWVERLLGGLDRVYLAHKWMGVWALGLASYHMIFKAELGVWEVEPILEISKYWTRLLRQTSFVALMFIILLALNRKIPYHLWRGWHKLSGPLFVVVILHWLTFKSPIVLNDPAGLWLGALSILGVSAAAWKLLLYPYFARHGEYEVVKVSPGAGAVRLSLAPVGGGVTFQPGQFGFLRLKEEGLREPHPFTIASANQESGAVEFFIRGLGDYTRKLVSESRVGMRADIYAPHGHFTRPERASHEVWVAGGVGISPFISWLQDPEAESLERVTLFYCYTLGREFPSVETLQTQADARGVELVPVPTGPNSVAFRERLAEIAHDVPADSVEVRFCGPQGLKEAVSQQMEELGIPRRNLAYEYFDFR
ncbi:ferredoxin reductase family protein [Halomonas halodenitrificans]|uniref:ferredoxin reductase family protein n=1 Tax=Halomonas halodenitrificans TaxID=28252 RepID=UPI00048751F8|nr:ferredoxin reductase family protein [Halomonas halodenitrificans]